VASAYLLALRRLARRDHSEEEVRRALLAKGHGRAEVEAALARLRGERAVDDAAFASRFARSRMAHSGLGRNRIRRDLRARGVAGRLVEDGLREAAREVSEPDLLDRAARRYWSAHAAEEPARRVRKLWAFLLRRGFPADLVHARLRALWPRWGAALDGLEPGGDGDELGRES
jgi:regulatory protein